MTDSVNDTHSDCHYAECHVSFITMLIIVVPPYALHTLAFVLTHLCLQPHRYKFNKIFITLAKVEFLVDVIKCTRTFEDNIILFYG